MTTIKRKNREFSVPPGYAYHVGHEDGKKYLVILVDELIDNDDHMFAHTIEQDVLFICDISVDKGLALAFPAINLDDLQGSEVILLSKENNQQYWCRDFGYEW